MIGHISRHDSTSLIVDRSALSDRNLEFATWVARYEGLPETGRKAWETVAPKPGLTMRSYSTENSELLVPINPLPCPIGLELVLVRRDNGHVGAAGSGFGPETCRGIDWTGPRDRAALDSADAYRAAWIWAVTRSKVTGRNFRKNRAMS